MDVMGQMAYLVLFVGVRPQTILQQKRHPLLHYLCVLQLVAPEKPGRADTGLPSARAGFVRDG